MFTVVIFQYLFMSVLPELSPLPYIQERCWAKNQKIEKQKDGSIILSMTTSGWFDVKKWLLSYGTEAELLEPADKRKELKEETSLLANLYK
jgi:proteasome accessory factor B